MKKQITRTLSAELKPYGNTDVDALKKIIDVDEERYNSRKDVIKMIDERHKNFINIIKDFQPSDELSFEKLEELVNKHNKDKKDKIVAKQLESMQKSICKELVTWLSSVNSDEYSRLTAPTPDKIIKELIVKEPENRTIRMFDRFSSYLSDYCTARKNIYSPNNKQNSIGHRVITENFQIYVKNKNTYVKLSNDYPMIIESVAATMQKFHDEMTGFTNTGDYMKMFSVQDGITKYNAIVGEFNKVINLYIQKNPDEKKHLKYLRMKTMRKQILFDVESIFCTLPKIYNEAELKHTIKNLWEVILNNGTVLDDMSALLCRLDKFDMNGIFFKKNKAGALSKKLYGDAIEANRILTEKYGKKVMEKRNYFPLSDIIVQDTDVNKFFQDTKCYSSEARVCFATINSSDNIMTDDMIKYVKNFMERLNDFRRISEVIAVTEDISADSDFYNSYMEYADGISVISKVYSMVKTFVCQRPKDISRKFPLTFDYPSFMSGWDFDKLVNNKAGAAMFIKDGRIYIGVSNKTMKPDYKRIRQVTDSELFFRMVSYKQFGNPKMQLPNLFRKDAPSNILRILDEKTDGEAYKREDMLKLVDYYKEKLLERYHDVYDFRFSETSSYKNINDFFTEVSKFTYRISFIDVPESQINEWIDNKKLFMFVVSTKDYAPGAHGSKELFTMYLENLFSEDNLNENIIRLNGGSSIMMRPKVIDKPYKHKTGSVVLNKRDIEGNPIPEDIYVRLFNCLNGKIDKNELSKEELLYMDRVRYKKTDYEIIKDRRYTEDKFIVHLPVTINPGCEVKDNDFNDKVRKQFMNGEFEHIIGIDRGERNILYVNVIDLHGKTVHEKSLNVLDGYDYQMKLTQLEKQRKDEQRNWKVVSQIKHIKEGYVGKAVYEICRLMFKYNAIVVLESLNKKFTTSRSAAFGPAVYAQFQNALLNKLSYLVLKDRKPMEEGGILNGYQFSFVPKDGIGDNPKQFGRVFFIPAGYTSKIDPVTGFTSLFNFSEYESSNKNAEKFIAGFDSIRINEDNVAEFKFDYSKFKTYVKWPEHKWTCIISGTRILNKKNPETGYWKYETVDVREKLNKLFSSYGKVLIPGTNIKALMIDIRKKNANIDKEFVKFIKVVMHMRNSNPETGEDYIISPAVDKNGQTFDSRDERNYKFGLPVNGDSNGARNIALKELMTLENEKTNGEFKSITNEEWFCEVHKFSE